MIDEIGATYEEVGFERVASFHIASNVTDEWYDQTTKLFMDRLQNSSYPHRDLPSTGITQKGTRWAEFELSYRGAMLTVNVDMDKKHHDDLEGAVTVEIREHRPGQVVPFLNMLASASELIPKQPNFLSRFVKEYQLSTEEYESISQLMAETYMQIHNRII